MYFLWDEYISFKTSATCAAAFNFNGSCKSSLASRFVLQMYLIKYIKKITRKPEVAETKLAPNHLSCSFYARKSWVGQLSLWIKLIAQLPGFKWAADRVSHFPISCNDPLPTQWWNRSSTGADISVLAQNRQTVTECLWQLHDFFEPPLSQNMKITQIFSWQTKY